MKEERYFYAPDAESTNLLPEDEAAHALRVLRYTVGDLIRLMDGKGNFYEAEITETSKKVCKYRISNIQPQTRQWKSYIHIAMAPTKNIERTEWFIEKAVEIGVDEITLLNTDFSERKKVNLERLEKIIVSAMKQSHKAFKPILNGLVDFDDFVKNVDEAKCFICHCYMPTTDNLLNERVLLKDQLKTEDKAVVLIGPEGDFSLAEVQEAEKLGFVSTSLGNSRLRTETAALVAVHIMSLFT